MASVQALPPPRSIIGPLPWLKQNLFSTWYHGLLTLLAMAAVVTLVRSALTWAVGEARWGAITSNLTLFMIGQYPRDQLWRIWLVIYLLALLIGSSWGLWKAVARGFALIALGAAAVFALSALQTDIWPIWAGVALTIALGYLAGPRLPRLRRAVVVGWIVYFPLSLALIGGSLLVPFLPPVDLIGQYPRDQLWRIWLVIYLLALLIGSSWGLWKAAVRGFALIALGAAVVFALTALQTDIWPIWAGAALIIVLGYLAGSRFPHLRWAVVVGWIVYFPLNLVLNGRFTLVTFLPPVDLNLWGGLLLTLALTVVGNIGALPLGILLALGRRSQLPALRAFCIGYIELIRGVPLITILYMAANMLPFFLPEGVRPDLVIRAMVGLVMFEAAYQAENVRGGLQAIPRGQYEAAHALGLNTTLTTVLVILPQALRLVIPALLNSFISLFKDTTLVAIVGLFDLLRVGRSVLAQSEWLGTHREVFAFAFLVYWGFNLAFSYGSRRLEKATGVGQR